MIESLLEFGEILAREIMVPRTEVVALPATAGVAEVLETIRQAAHSRYPVYLENIDHIKGILHVKDLLSVWGAAEVDLTAICREVIFIPETKKITALLAEMRARRSHMAVVVDEYGGTAGVLTIEDIIEQIVGDIQDEHDTEEPWMTNQPDGSVLVDGRLDVDELADRFELEIEKNGFDTVGGFITSHTGQVPQAGQVITARRLEMTIEDADERRVKKVRVRPAPTD